MQSPIDLWNKDVKGTRQPIFQVGTILNQKWMILELVGMGGIGEVYKAHQLNLKRDVAIKVLSKEKLCPDSKDDLSREGFLSRFRQEVKTMAQIRHPNVLQVYDYGCERLEKGEEKESIEYMVMEYIPGKTLRYTMPEDGFGQDETLVKEWLNRYFLPVLEGVRAIHALGIFHRDLKPENILIDNDIPKIADFGLAHSSQLKPITRSSGIQGTITYMAPEQFIDFKRVDHRADLYALGKILFEMIDGKNSPKMLPFKCVELSEPLTPFFQKMNDIIRSATAEEKDQRPESIEKFREQIIDVLKYSTIDLKTRESKFNSVVPSFNRRNWLWAGIPLVVLSLLLGQSCTFKTPASKSYEVPGFTSDFKPLQNHSNVPQSPSQRALNRVNKSFTIYENKQTNECLEWESNPKN